MGYFQKPFYGYLYTWVIFESHYMAIMHGLFLKAIKWLLYMAIIWLLYMGYF